MHKETASVFSLIYQSPPTTVLTAPWWGLGSLIEYLNKSRAEKSKEALPRSNAVNPYWLFLHTSLWGPPALPLSSGHPLLRSTLKFCHPITKALPVSPGNSTTWRSAKLWGPGPHCSICRYGWCQISTRYFLKVAHRNCRRRACLAKSAVLFPREQMVMLRTVETGRLQSLV